MIPREGVDLRNRMMVHPPWNPATCDRDGVWPQPAEALIEVLEAYREAGGSEEELFELLNRHIPDSSFVFSSAVLNSGKSFSLEFYFYLFTFAKFLLKDIGFCFKGSGGPLSVYHYISERGFLNFPPWHGDDVRREGYLSQTNVRALFVYAESVTEPGGTAGIGITGPALAAEVLGIANQSVEERYRVQREFFDKEEVQISFEYLYYLTTLFECFFNQVDFLTRACRYGFMHNHHFVNAFFLRSGLSPANRFQEWLEYTSQVYYFTFREKRTSLTVGVDTSRVVKTGMLGQYVENCMARTSLAVPEVYKIFFEIATGKRVRSRSDLNGPLRFTVRLAWGDPLHVLVRLSILAGSWAVTGALAVLLKLRGGELVSPFLIVTLVLTVLSLSSKLRTLKGHQEKVNSLITTQMTSLERVTRELVRERDGLSSTVRERTRDLEAAVDQLRSLDRSKTNFIASVSHELRTPITLISLPLEEILEGRYGESIGRESRIFRLMKRNTLRLQRQINQLLDFARFDLGIQPLKKEPLDLIRFCTDLAVELESLAASRDLNLRFISRLPQEKVFIEADVVQLETLMMNLLGNAFKFTPRGEVTVNLEPGLTPSEVCLSVIDTGIGFTAEQKEKIFDRFFQVEGDSDRRFEGAGLGLALVKEIVLRHAWTIEAAAEEDRGASFTLTLPVCEIGGPRVRETREGADRIGTITAQLDPAKQSPGLLTRKNAEKILIVDDNADMASILSDILSTRYLIEWCSGGAEAFIRLSEKRDFILIICDMMMPGMSGLDFRKKYLEIYPEDDIPFIFLTALADQSNRNRAFELGGVDYITKPFNAGELQMKIENLIHFNRSQYTKALRDSEGVERLLRMNDRNSAADTDDFMDLFNITKSEKKVVELLRNGFPDKDIAESLNISPRTVSTHLRNLYRKTETRNRVELLNKFYRQ